MKEVHSKIFLKKIKKTLKEYQNIFRKAKQSV